MTVTEVPPTVDVMARPRKRRGSVLLWVVGLAVCGALFGIAVASTLPPSYLAEGSVVVAPLRGNAYQGSGDKLLTDLETESQLVSSDAVLRRVAADGGVVLPSAEVRERLSVGVVPNASVLTIRYRSSDPQEARDMVQRLAAATLAERVERSKAAGAQRAEVVQRMLTDAEKDLTEIQEEAAKAAAEGSDETQGARLRLATQRMNSLYAELAEAVGDPGDPGRLITVVNRGDASSKRVKLALVGGCALLAALLGAWVGRSSRSRKR